MEFILTGKVTGTDGRAGTVEVAEYPSNRIYACFHSSFKGKTKLEPGDTATFVGELISHDKVMVKGIAGVELPSTVE
jgi:hypothetical protein